MATLGEIEHYMDLGAAGVKLLLDQESYQKGLEDAKAALQGFKDSAETGTSSLQKFSDLTGSVGSSMYRKVTVPVIAGAKSIISAFTSTEDAFIGVKKTLDSQKLADSFKINLEGVKNVDEALTPAYNALDKAIWDMTQETSSSYESIAAVMEMAGQLNVALGENGKGLIDFTKNIIMLNDATDLMGADAAKDLAQFTNITRTSEEEFGNLGATIVDLGNNSATTEAAIVSMAMRLAGGATSLGLTEQEILAIAATLQSVGISAEMGGSAFQKALKKMSDSSVSYDKIIDLQNKTGMSLEELNLMAQNDSKSFTSLAASIGMGANDMKKLIKTGLQLQGFAEVSNMSMEEFATTMKNEPIKAVEAFVLGLGNTEKVGKTTVEMLQDMGFTEVRLSDTLTRLAMSQDDLTVNLQRANDAWKEGTALEDEAERRYEGLKAQISQLNELWKQFRVELAQFVVPILKDLMEIARDLIHWLQGLPDPLKEVLIHATAIVAIVGPFLLTLSKITSVILNVTNFFKGLGKLIEGVAGPLGKFLGSFGKIEGLGKLLSGVAGTIGGVIQTITGIAGIIAGPIMTIMGFINQIKEGANLADSAWQVLGGTIAGIAAMLLGLTGPIGILIGAAIGAVLAIVSAIIGSWDEIAKGWEKFKDGFVKSIKKQWDEFWKGFKDIPKKIMEHIVNPIKKALEDGFQLADLLTIGGAIVEGLFKGILFMMEHFNPLVWLWKFLIKPIIDGVKELLGIHSPSTVFMEIGGNIVEGLLEGIKNLWENVLKFFEEAIKGLLEWFASFFSDISDFVDRVWTGVSEGLQKIWDNVTKWFSDLWDSIAGWFGDLVGGVVDWLSGVWEGISGWFADVISGIGDFFGEVWETLTEKWNEITKGVSEFFEGVWETVSGWFSDLIEGVSEFFSGIWETVTGWLDDIWTGISDFFSGLVEDIGKWFSDVGKSINDAFQGVKEIVDTVIDTLEKAWDDFVKFIKELFEDIIKFIEDSVKNLKKFIEDVGKAVGEFFEGIFKTLGELWENVKTFMGEVFEKIFTFVSDKIEALWKWIKEIPGKFVQIGKDIIGKLWEGLKKAWDDIATWFEDKFGWVSKLVEKITGKLREITSGISEKISGSHANGLDYVPFNGYVAELHKGERVLTKQENEEYSRGNHGSGGGDTFNFYNTQPDPYEYARQMKRAKKELLYS